MEHFKLPSTSGTSYYGGKSGAGTYQTIINRIPEHDVYIEPFLGFGGILRHKRPAKYSYGYDLDPKITTMWDQVKRDSHLKVQNLNGLEHLHTFNAFEKPFIYLDPPYPLDSRKSKRKVYKYEMTNFEHQFMLDLLRCLPMNMAISTYPNELYLEILKPGSIEILSGADSNQDLIAKYSDDNSKWRILQFTSSTRKGKATEWLFMNYPRPTKLHDYEYIGENYREREVIKKRVETIRRKLNKLPILQRNKILNILQEDYL